MNIPRQIHGHAKPLDIDPLAGVLSLGPRLPAWVIAIAIVIALSLHAGAAVGAVQAAFLHAFATWAHSVRGSVAERLAQTYDVDMLKPEPEKPKEEPKEEPKPEEPKALVKEVPKDEPAAPPPAPSEAQKVLTQEPSKDEPEDLTGNAFLAGNGDQANSGPTQINGTGKPNPAAVKGGTPGGTGTVMGAPPPVKVDRSRPARILNLANLSQCPFPEEANAEQIDDASVVIEIKVGIDGRAESASIRSDPGHGFGREARKCAMRERYNPALNVDGAPIPGTYAVRFTFSR